MTEENTSIDVDKMSSLKINSKTEITDVYHIVIQDVIKNMKGVFRDENISLYVLQDLEALWTNKFLKTRQKSLPVTLVPMKIMVPFKKTPSAVNTEIREIELMVPQHEAELLDFRTIFSEGIMNAVVNLSDKTATTFLQQRINKFLVSKDQVEEMIFVKEPENPETLKEENLLDHLIATKQGPSSEDLIAIKKEPINDVDVSVKQEILDDFITIKQEPLDEITIKEEPLVWEIDMPQADGGFDSSEDESSVDTESSSSQKSKDDVDQSSYGSDGETLNSEDDVTDEDIETLFDSDNVILCQYLKVLRCKNKWRFYFKDAVMSLDGCDYAFHKIFGDAPW